MSYLYETLSENRMFGKENFLQILAENPLGQSDRSILEIAISREPFPKKLKKKHRKSKTMIGSDFWTFGWVSSADWT